MRILSFDQSTRITGWAVMEDGQLIDYGKFELEGEMSDRCLQLFMDVEEFIKSFKPDLVVYEGIQYQANLDTFKKLAQSQIAVMMAAFANQVESEEVYSASWKSSNRIAGRTRVEQKRNAQAKVTELFNIKATQDESDAILLANHLFLTKRFW